MAVLIPAFSVLSPALPRAISIQTLTTTRPPRLRRPRRRVPSLSVQTPAPSSDPATPPPPTPATPPSRPPLPPPSRLALSSAALLSLSALAVPALLTLRDAPAAFLPHLLSHYPSHLLIILFTSLFALVHSGLASLRPYLTPVLGERLYRVGFALLSLPSATALIAYFIAHRYDGAQLWRVQNLPGLHDAVYIATFVSFLLLYPATFNLLEVAAVQKPTLRIYETGVTRITRHPQLWGQILWCVAHTAWMGTSFTLVASLCLVAHHSFGAWNGDRRLRDRFGEEWIAFAQRTSIVPFAAVVSGKQNLAWGEFFRPAYLGVVAFVLATYAAHPLMLRTVGNLHL